MSVSATMRLIECQKYIFETKVPRQNLRLPCPHLTHQPGIFSPQKNFRFKLETKACLLLLQVSHNERQ